MSLTTSTTYDSNTAVAGSAAYGLIAHGFRYPDDEWLAALTDPNRWQGWTEHLLRTHPEATEPLSALRIAVEDLSNPPALENLQEQFALLFGHSVRGKCPPYELEFGKSEVIQRASDLADLSGFYAAFGMELTGDVSERPDHISVEAEFMSVLCAKAVCGIENDDQGLIETVHAAQRQFLNSHLGRWFPAFVQRVKDSAACSFYICLAEFANAFIACECRRFGVSLGSPYLQLRPVDPVQEMTQSCGVPGECATPGEQQLTQLNVGAGIQGNDGP